MSNEKDVQRLLKGAPGLREQDARKINELYRPFLFRKHKTGEVWASCCGKYGVVEKNSPVMLAEHCPEPRSSFRGCGHAWPAPPAYKPQTSAACPFCGRKADVKEIGRTGSRKNLWDYRRVIVLRWFRGALWALGYETEKGYPDTESLTRDPAGCLVKVWRFVPGKAEYIAYNSWTNEWGGYRCLKATKLKAGWKFPEGFSYCAQYGMGYDMIGLSEAVGQSTFRYCGLEQYRAEGFGQTMKFLALCTVYPRQVEMLMKAKLYRIVEDMLNGKRNQRIFNWDEPKPLKSFGLDKEEMQAFLQDREVHTLENRRKLLRAGVPVTVQELVGMRARVGDLFTECVKRMAETGTSPERLLNYFAREAEANSAPVSQVAGWWRDYLNIAEKQGLDMQNRVFFMPKDLREKHDAQIREMNRERKGKERREEEARRKKLEGEKELYRKGRLGQLVKQYTYTDGRWLIRPPRDAEEIVAEGKALHHCVGGYAERHIRGAVTILFLRDREKPGKPLVTVEMAGNKIVQIHGWKDEREECPENPNKEDPRELYREFLDGWLAWLTAGSKRQKKRKPVRASA